MTDEVEIIEVGPRDGLQSQSEQLSTVQKKQWITSLAEAGFKRIEVGSFVSPKAIPAMADTAELLRQLPKNFDRLVLVPNQKGMELALKAGVEEVAIFTAVSDGFCQKNINCSVEESLQRFEKVFELAHKNNIRVRGYISCVYTCPYEGKMNKEKLWPLAEKLFEKGCHELSIGDTLGDARAEESEEIFSGLSQRFDKKNIVGHFHNTQGRALENIDVLLGLGFRKFDASAGGLGGCPYAPGASGNVASDDVLALLRQKGYRCSVDAEKLHQSSLLLQSHLSEKLPSQHFQALRQSK